MGDTSLYAIIYFLNAIDSDSTFALASSYNDNKLPFSIVSTLVRLIRLAI